MYPAVKPVTGKSILLFSETVGFHCKYLRKDLSTHTTIPILLCCPGVANSTASSRTRFMNGSNPLKIPCTCLFPFNFTEIEIIHFMAKGSYMVSLNTGCLEEVPPFQWKDEQNDVSRNGKERVSLELF